MASTFGWLATSSTTYQILYAAADTFFLFLPMFLGDHLGPEVRRQPAPWLAEGLLGGVWQVMVIFGVHAGHGPGGRQLGQGCGGEAMPRAWPPPHW